MRIRSNITKTKGIRSECLTMSRKAKKSRKKTPGTGHLIGNIRWPLSKCHIGEGRPESGITDLRCDLEVLKQSTEQNCLPSAEANNWVIILAGSPAGPRVTKYIIPMNICPTNEYNDTG